VSPRTLPASYEATRKQHRRAHKQADRDNTPMAVVRYDNLVFVRPLAKAMSLCVKHPEAKILHECFPGDPS